MVLFLFQGSGSGQESYAFATVAPFFNSAYVCCLLQILFDWYIKGAYLVYKRNV